MTHRNQHSAPSPDFSSSSSLTDIPRRKHGIRALKHKVYDDYTEGSVSQSPYEFDDEEYYEESVETGTNAAEDQSIPRGKSFKASSSVNSSSESLNRMKQPTSYINIAPLPMFGGASDECPITHLSRFTKVCRANNVSSVEMMMRIFPVTLDNEAALWYDLNIEPYSSLSWEQIKSSFLQAYYRDEVVDELRSELMMINQGSQESVRSYLLRLQWILKRWPDHGLPDDLLQGIFIDGLRKDFQDWIIPQRPASLNEALSLAFNWEKVQSIRGVRENVCGFCGGEHEGEVCDIRERMRGLWIKNKEKQMRDCQRRAGSDEGGEMEFERGDSVGGECVVGRSDEREDGMTSWKKKKSRSQCQCWKHQCWKKKLESNKSFVTRNDSNAG